MIIHFMFAIRRKLITPWFCHKMHENFVAETEIQARITSPKKSTLWQLPYLKNEANMTLMKQRAVSTSQRQLSFYYKRGINLCPSKKIQTVTINNVNRLGYYVEIKYFKYCIKRAEPYSTHRSFALTEIYDEIQILRFHICKGVHFLVWLSPNRTAHLEETSYPP